MTDQGQRSSAPASQVQGSNWGRWGADDERGALNLITSAAILGAAAAVRRGRVYSLSLPIDPDGAPIVDGRGEPRRLTLTCDSDDERYASFGAAPGVGANQDVLMLASHHGTHIDALSHVFADRVMYNGFESSTFKSFSGAGRLGIEKLGAVVGRGVLLDIAAHMGVDSLPEGYCITGEDLESCAAREHVDVRPGDILLVRTGWVESWRQKAAGEGGVGQPGIGLGAAAFVRDHDIAAVGADIPPSKSSPSTTEPFWRCTLSCWSGSGSLYSSTSTWRTWPETRFTSSCSWLLRSR